MEVNQILLDWEWTVTQHEKGADFAAKHCKKQPRPADPEILTCPTTKESQDATLVR